MSALPRLRASVAYCRLMPRSCQRCGPQIPLSCTALHCSHPQRALVSDPRSLPSGQPVPIGKLGPQWRRRPETHWTARS